MARKNDSSRKAAMREMMRNYLKNNDISVKNGTGVNSIMRDMMSVLLEDALNEELDEKLGYSKYDYRNKNRNGHSQKTMHTHYGDMDVAIPAIATVNMNLILSILFYTFFLKDVRLMLPLVMKHSTAVA